MLRDDASVPDGAEMPRVRLGNHEESSDSARVTTEAHLSDGQHLADDLRVFRALSAWRAMLPDGHVEARENPVEVLEQCTRLRAHQAGRLFYHAWAEVMLEGRWVTVDPTWGQLPADVTHLRFVRGGLGKQMAMFSVIGRVEQVQVVETTP